MRTHSVCSELAPCAARCLGENDAVGLSLPWYKAGPGVSASGWHAAVSATAWMVKSTAEARAVSAGVGEEGAEIAPARLKLRYTVPVLLMVSGACRYPPGTRGLVLKSANTKSVELLFPLPACRASFPVVMVPGVSWLSARKSAAVPWALARSTTSTAAAKAVSRVLRK